MKWVEWIQKAMSDSTTNSPSTKRLGHITGIMIASIVSLVMLGAIIGLTYNVAPINFQFVYSTLNSTITWIIGFLVVGGSGVYAATRGKETDQSNEKVTSDGGDDK